jgi:hypothetical protein
MIVVVTVTMIDIVTTTIEGIIAMTEIDADTLLVIAAGTGEDRVRVVAIEDDTVTREEEETKRECLLKRKRKKRVKGHRYKMIMGRRYKMIT